MLTGRHVSHGGRGNKIPCPLNHSNRRTSRTCEHPDRVSRALINLFNPLDRGDSRKRGGLSIRSPRLLLRVAAKDVPGRPAIIDVSVYFLSGYLTGIMRVIVQKIVLKVQLNCEKWKRRAMKTVAGIEGKVPVYLLHTGVR